jgi:hypothetical protein
MKKSLRLTRYCATDWVAPPKQGVVNWILCHERLSEWFDIEGLETLEVVVSTTPMIDGYECRFNSFMDFEIQDPGTGRWYFYYVYCGLRRLIMEIGPRDIKKGLYPEQFWLAINT